MNRFATRAEARDAIREYIEIFYNRSRKQARLGYLSPVQFAMQHRHRQAAH
jgi:putative transposase